LVTERRTDKNTRRLCPKQPTVTSKLGSADAVFHDQVCKPDDASTPTNTSVPLIEIALFVPGGTFLSIVIRIGGTLEGCPIPR